MSSTRYTNHRTLRSHNHQSSVSTRLSSALVTHPSLDLPSNGIDLVLLLESVSCTTTYLKGISLSMKVLLLIKLVLCSGVLVHTEVQRRALHILGLPASHAAKDDLPMADYLVKYQDYAQPGVFFPDWGYGCLSSDVEAETAHWPPFLGAATAYLLKEYPDLKTSEPGQQLLSFIHGVSAHQNTDATWHSIRFRDGFLKAMAVLDFDGDVGAAHSVLDIGGDTVLAGQFSQHPDGFDHIVPSWSVPRQDIINIYASMNITVSSFKLRYCMGRGFAAISALKRAGSLLSTRYKSKSPFMTTQLEQYHLGSIDESVTSTVKCWQSLASWINSGQVPSHNDTWNRCEPLRTIAKRGKSGPDAEIACQHGLTRFIDEHPLLIDNEYQTIDVVDHDGVVTFTRPHSKSSRKTTTIDGIFLTAAVPYAEFGSSFAVVPHGNSVSIAIGSPKDTDVRDEPSRGGVYVVPLETQELASALRSQVDVVNYENQVALGRKVSLPTNSIYFGQSVVSLTIRGRSCIAVLSSNKVEIFREADGTFEVEPEVIIADLSHRTKFSDAPIAKHIEVFKHKGQTVLALLRPWSGFFGQGSVILFSEATLQSGYNDLSAGLIVTTGAMIPTKFGRFGSALAYSDNTGILFIGSGGTGDVYAFALSRDISYATRLYRIFDPSPQSLETGFGTVLYTQADLLFIGSPTENAGATQAGVVRIYGPISQESWTATVLHTITPTAPNAFAHFGSSISPARDGQVYISSPDWDNRGAVFLYNSTDRLDPLVTGEINSRFGHQVATLHNTTLISAPYASAGIARRAGKLFYI